MHGQIPPIRRPQGMIALSRLALSLAWRDLRGGLRGFGVFIACLALGVAAIAAVTSVARGVGEGLGREGKRILGGDAAFALVHREATESERAFLAARGAVSVMATMRAMVNAGDKGTALVEIKAVDSAYPTIGDIRSEPQAALSALLAPRDGLHGVLVDPLIPGRLGLATGDVVRVGEAEVRIAGTILSEPDKVAAGIGLGPRLLMTEAALRQTGLVQPGSLIRWTYRVNLPGDEAASAAPLAALEAEARRALPDAGWEVRTRANADPRFSRNIDRFSQFLTLVGLTALLVGGVGVANAVRRFVDAKRLDFATLKALGAPGSQVVAIHLVEVMLVAIIGVSIGVAVGASLPFILAGLLADVLPLPLAPTIAWTELGVAALYGLVTALVFALLPLGQAHDTPVSALFRDVVDSQDRRPRALYLVAFAAALAAMIGITILFAYDARIATIYIGVIAATFVLLRLVGFIIMRVAAAMPRAAAPSLRMAIANMHRPGALTPALVLSLGLGVALLSALAFIDVSLNRALTQNLPARAPSFFFLDIPNTRTAEFDAFIRRQAPGAEIERVPLMRGRLVALNDTPAEQVKAADRFGWVLEGDRGLSYAATLPRDSRLVTGEWWAPDHSGEPLVSFDHDLATGLGLRLGDRVTVNVLGRNITARLANTRKVEWRNLGINFVMLFSPNAFAGAPHSHLATLTVPAETRPLSAQEAATQDAALLRELGRSFPAVTAVRVKDALEAANDLVGKLTLAIRVASGIAVAASLLVLAGALAAGQRARLYDAMILKTLGATRRRIMASYGLEYALTGGVAALFGLVAGAGAGWAVTTRAMNIDFVFAPGSAIILASVTICIAVGFGLIGTMRILAKKPASYLRSL
ncbi:MAG: FtsX-like permease family protein [Bosea sp.]|jgi:putative ABC transport system permease protein|nr:FtsX-like permease family protein [Bosea sp. (in: a-proteobacteria)]